MRAHFVLAHPEPHSYNAALVSAGAAALAAAGWSVSVSDLHRERFDPIERPEHYPERADSTRFDVQAEQRRASAAGTLPSDVRDEIAALDAADLVIFQYPMWWHLPPAMLKGYFDRVFAYGEVYTATKRFEHGRFVGKRALLSVTVPTPAASYAHDGRSGDIELMLWPVHFNLAYVGFAVLAPFVSYDVGGAVYRADPEQGRARLGDNLEAFAAALVHSASRPSLAFNTMAQWGDDQRIKPDAPAHSPFIRHNKTLRLE